MKSRSLLMVALLIVSACRAASADPVPQELDRLSALLTKIEADGVPDMLKETFAPNRAAIERARKTTSPQLRLYRLREAYVGVETVAFVAAQKDAAGNLDKFIALWNARPVSATTTPAAPLLQAALVQTATNRAEKLYRASLPYGKADGPLSGLYYLGEAHANAAFARLVASMETNDAEEAPKEKALRNALAAMETDMLRVFEKDPAAPAMIGVSVRLKEARELLDRGSLAGATLLLREAKLAYDRATTKTAIEVDPVAELGRVGETSAAILPAAAAKQVRVTLIRWPYT